MTANASIETAVTALQKGAFDYLTKPFEPARLIQTVKNALDKSKLLNEKKAIENELITSKRDYQYLVENSPDIIYTLDEKGNFTFINPRSKDSFSFV